MGLNLSLTTVSKEYRGKPVLRNCSYSFAGGVHALMGPNGCGKSTLLRVSALLEPAGGGEVRYREGENTLPHDLELRRRITLVLPRVGVFNTTVLRNASYGLRLRGVHADSCEKRARAALEAVGLEHKLRQNALTLSSGETQRLGLARAMALEPEILFLDEPTASIDEENSRIVEKIILSLKQAGRTTVILSTHDREQAERLADAVVMMKEGAILS